ncbi:glycerol-3-phosphate dehydrogenase/oxidase [Desulfococcus sp.]|uniref:glycerol-3-phosphate dehydrogenase/oxidase n=1 Tax=Desulfococcus sp. TaxID=2025834 RepID=UPI0035935C97
MNRDEMLKRIRRQDREWDLIVVGGGATGLGTAIDGASRGYQVLLVEQSDFAKGTSSRSTKLVHGGVRYLQQGNVSLVLEALKERGLMRRNAPHLVHNLPFVVPNYDWWEGPFYGIGLKVYDMLAGRHGFGHSKGLSKEKTLAFIPTLEPRGLRGGVIYYDGQFDDARLAVNMAQTAVEQGGTVVNYMRVESLVKSGGMVRGVNVRDMETGEAYALTAKVVINATGVFSDAVRRMDDPEAPGIITPSQGVHIVLDKSFMPGDTAIMVPHTDDGRVLFAIPWKNRVVVGTTDTEMADAPLDPCPLPEEIDFLLSHAARYLTKDPTREDILSAFAGLRPLVSLGGYENTAAISRDHTLNISRSGLLTITGGKWTTYRKMAEDTVDQAALLAQLQERPSVTKELNIHGFHQNAGQFGHLAVYGSDAVSVQALLGEDPRFACPLHPAHPYLAGEVVWAVRREMARTVEDFLSRRRRVLILDARASMEMAPVVARLMALELGRDGRWESDQTRAFEALARGYLGDGVCPA